MCLRGDTNPETVDKLEEKISIIAATIKSCHFDRGSKFGHLPIIMPESVVKTILEDNKWEYKPAE